MPLIRNLALGKKRRVNPVVPFSPSQLGAKLRHWSEVDGLVINSTTANGIVDGSGNVSQITDLSGNVTHWIQIPGGVSATAVRPVLSSGKVAFTKASNHGMYSPALLADVVGNTQGEVIICYRKKSGLNAYPFCFGAAADSSKRSALGIEEFGAADRSIILVDSGASVQQLSGQQFSETPFLIHAFSSNGSSYKVVHEIQDERAEETLAVVVGANNGDWFADVAPGIMGLFCFLDGTDVFHSGDYCGMIVCNEQLTAEERGNVFCYFNNKYGVWL